VLPAMPPWLLLRAKTDLIQELLSHCACIEPIDPSVLNQLSTLLEMRALGSGEVLHIAGDPLTHLPLIVQGSVRLSPSPTMEAAAAGAEEAACAAFPASSRRPGSAAIAMTPKCTNLSASASAPLISHAAVATVAVNRVPAPHSERQPATTPHAAAVEGSTSQANQTKAISDSRGLVPAPPSGFHLASTESVGHELWHPHLPSSCVPTADSHTQATYVMQSCSSPLLSHRAYRLSLPHIESAEAGAGGAVVLLLPTRHIARICRLAPPFRALIGRRLKPNSFSTLSAAPQSSVAKAAAKHKASGAARIAAIEEISTLLDSLTWTQVLSRTTPTMNAPVRTIAQAAHELHLDDSRPSTAVVASGTSGWSTDRASDVCAALHTFEKS